MYIDEAKRAKNKTNTKLNNMASASHEKNKNAPQDSQWIGS